MVREYLGADGTFHGFIWENGRFTALDLPGAAATSAAGINDRGPLIGSHLDAAGVRLRGFLLSYERCASFDAPGAQLTVPLGINRISGGSLSADSPVTAT